MTDFFYLIDRLLLMTTVILMRHAQASFTSADFDRSLNQNGLNEANQMGQRLADLKLHVDVVLCSSAARAVQTLACVSSKNQDWATPVFYKELYLAPLTTLIDVVSQWHNKTEHLLLLGHNPGLESLLKYLCGSDIPHDTNGALFSTANCAIINLDGAIAGGTGKLITLLRPES